MPAPLFRHKFVLQHTSMSFCRDGTCLRQLLHRSKGMRDRHEPVWKPKQSATSGERWLPRSSPQGLSTVRAARKLWAPWQEESSLSLTSNDTSSLSSRPQHNLGCAKDAVELVWEG